MNPRTVATGLLLFACASRPTATPATVPTPPAETESVDAQLAYLGQLCSPLLRVRTGDGAIHAGCDCCPNEAEGCKPADPSSAVSDSTEALLSVDRLFRGAFRKPNVDEVVMITTGCSSAAANEGGIWVGLVQGPALSGLQYLEGNHPTGCKRMPREEGIDRLLCTFTHGRDHTSTHALVVNLTRPDDDLSDSELVEVVSTVETLCQHGPGAVVDNRIESTSVSDVDHDGRADVEVVVTTRSGDVSAKTLEACGENGFAGDTSKLLDSPRREVLRFLGGPGLKFHPDEATKKVIARL